MNTVSLKTASDAGAGVAPKLGFSTAISSITIGQAALVLIVVVGAAMRLTGLGLQPLSPDEAKEALSVWQAWQADSMPPPIYSASYFSLTGLASQLLGFGDAAMRLAPALLGSATIILPWFLRDLIGRYGALASALFLATSPIHSLVSRTAGGQSIAVFAGLLLLVSWLRFREGGERRWLLTAFAALAVGIASASLFYSVLAGVSAAAAIQWRAGHVIGGEGKGFFGSIPRSSLRQATLLGLVLFLMISTSLFLFPRGIGAPPRLLAQWLGLFGASADATAWVTPFLAIGRYEPAMFVIGGIAAVWASWNGRPYALYLVYAFGASILLMVVQGSYLENVLVLTLPGYLLIGALVGHVLQPDLGAPKWQLAVTLLGLGAVVYVNVARMSRLTGTAAEGDRIYHVIVLLFAILLGAAIVSIVWNWDSRVGQQGTLIGLLILAILYQWGTAWWITRDGAGDTRERWITSATHRDLPRLAETVREISWQATNSPGGLQISSSVDSSSLRWYLKGMQNLSFGESSVNSPNSPALIADRQDSPQLRKKYAGADFGHVRPDTRHELNVNQALQWWLFHQSGTPRSEERIMLWVRADLAGVALE